MTRRILSYAEWDARSFAQEPALSRMAHDIERDARRVAQKAADTYGFAWLYRFHDEWQIVCTVDPDRPDWIPNNGELFVRQEKTPD